MLLEQLAEQAARPPQYDWEAYYRWLLGTLAGRDAGDSRFWLCERCFSVNLLHPGDRYGRCRGCRVLYLAGEAAGQTSERPSGRI